MATNQQKLDGVFDAIFNGGGSMRGGKSLQGQLADAEAAAAAALAAPLIKGWPGPNGTTYNTSVLQQLVYITQDLQSLKTLVGELKEAVALLNTKLTAHDAKPAASVSIDAAAAALIAEKLPKYKLSPETGV